MEIEPSIKNQITSLWGLSYDKTYIILEVDTKGIVIDKENYPVRFYARFFELANAKSVGFIIE